MRIYYDTEFIEDGYTIDLVSIGMVAEDGHELYAVSADFNEPELLADPWLVENVWPSLPTRDGTLDTQHPDVHPRGEIARAVRDFILRDPAPELWAWYGAYDHVVLCQLWGRMIDLPPGVPMWTHEIEQEVQRRGNPKMPEQVGGEHNALADARHVKVMAEYLDWGSGRVVWDKGNHRWVRRP